MGWRWEEKAFIIDESERIPRGLRDVQSSHGKEGRGRLARVRDTSPKSRGKSGSKRRIFWGIEEKTIALGFWSSLAGNGGA